MIADEREVEIFEMLGGRYALRECKTTASANGAPGFDKTSVRNVQILVTRLDGEEILFDLVPHGVVPVLSMPAPPTNRFQTLKKLLGEPITATVSLSMAANYE